MTTRTDQGFPKLSEPIVDPKSGLINQTWLQLLITLWNRTGGPSGSTDRFETDQIQAALADAQNRLVQLETPPPETSEFLNFAAQFQDVVSRIPALRHELLDELDKRIDAATLLVPPQVISTASGGTGGVDNYNIISLSGNTSGTLNTYSATTLVLAGGNNITLSQDGVSITISGANTGTAGDNYNILSASGNTAGTLTSFAQGTFVLAGGNNITLSQSSNTLTILGPNTVAQSVQTYNVLSASGNTSGTLTSFSTGTIVLAGGNNITLSQSSNSITISGPNTVAQSIQTYNVVSAGGNTAGALATFSTGTIVFAGGNNITLSQSSNTITISAGNGGGGAGVTLSAWEPRPSFQIAAATYSFSRPQFMPFVLPNNLTCSVLNALLSMQNTTNTNTAQVGYTYFAGIYTRVGSATDKISSVFSTSYTAQASYSSNASWGESWNGSTFSSAGTALRNQFSGTNFRLNIGCVTSFSAGEYWFAMMHSSSSAGSSAAMMTIGIPFITMQNPPVFPGNTTANVGFVQGQGTWSATTSALPGVVNLTDIGAFSRGLYFNFYNADLTG